MKKTLPILLIICILLSLCSCRTMDNPGEYPVTIGNVVISEKPTATVCMSDSIADIMIACGLSTSITARSEDCDQEAIFPLPTVGSNENPDINAIINTGCTLVLADSKLNDDAKTALTNAGITVITMTPASTRDELTKMYSNICAIFDGNTKGRENGTKKVENLFTSIDELNRQIPESQIVNTACYIYDVVGDVVKLVTGDCFASKLIDYTNTTNVGAGSINSELDATSLKMQNPKFIFCAPGVRQKLESHQTLSKLYALSENNVFELEATAMTRQGNTILTTVEFMVKSMYPQLSGDYVPTDTDTLTDTDTSLDTSSETDTEDTDTEDSDITSETEDTDTAFTTDVVSQITSGTRYMVNSDDGLSLRSSPTIAENIVAGLEPNEIVVFIEDAGNGWYKVKRDDGTVGYCSSEFLIEP